MTRFTYLAALAVSAAGMWWFDRSGKFEVFGARLWRSAAVTVPLFLAIDILGAVRGWFHSDPRLNVAIFPPGIPLEEPVLLTFLVAVAVLLWRAAGGLAEPRPGRDR